MRWIRLDSCFDDGWLFSLSPGSQLAWVKLLCTVKRDGVKGRMKALNPVVSARRWGIGEEDIAKMFHAGVEDGAIEIVNGEWVITNWAKFQETDYTATERQRRRREKQAVTGVTGSNGSHGVTTVTNRDHCHATETETETERLVTTSDTSLGGVGGKQQRGTRLPKDWEPSKADLEFCQKQRPDLRVGEVAEGFRDYWHSKAGAAATKLDWSATWRNWVRGQKSSGKPKNPYSDLTQLNRDLKAYLEESN